MEFDCQGSDSGTGVYDVSVDYVFASNEYMGLKDNQTAPFNDVIGIFLNGESPADNIATVEGQVVSVNNIRVGSPFHVKYSHNGQAPFVVGTTVPMIATGKTTKKMGNKIQIALADMDDVMYNSYIFVSAESLTCKPGVPAEPTITPVAPPSNGPAISIPPSLSPSNSQAPTLNHFNFLSGTAMELAEKIKGRGVRIKGAELMQEACQDKSAAMYAGGAATIGPDTGVVLTSGHVSSLVDGFPGDCSNKGYAPLEPLVKKGASIDATVLKIEFECAPNKIGLVAIDFVFASYEYDGIDTSTVHKHDDVVGIFLNGKDPKHNIAKVNGETVSINAIPPGSDLYVDNDVNRLGRPGASAPHVSGYTKVIRAEKKSQRVAHTMYIAIADIHDDSVDSFVFIREGSLKCYKSSAPAPTTPPTASKAPTTADTLVDPTASCTRKNKSCAKSKECCDGRLCAGRNKKKQKCKKCADLKDNCSKNKDCCGADNDTAKCKDNTCVATCAAKREHCSKNQDCCKANCDKDTKKCAK
jgi:hypothetical protein